VKLLNLNIQFW